MISSSPCPLSSLPVTCELPTSRVSMLDAKKMLTKASPVLAPAMRYSCALEIKAPCIPTSHCCLSCGKHVATVCAAVYTLCLRHGRERYGAEPAFACADRRSGKGRRRRRRPWTSPWPSQSSEPVCMDLPSGTLHLFSTFLCVCVYYW